jgi:hypothetical protein
MITEAIVRHSLREVMLAGSLQQTEAVYEFWVPRSNERADVAIIGGCTFEGFEIKTDRDTLKRLPRQAQAYSRLFDRCSVVLAPRHVDAAMEILPSWWGVLVINCESNLTFQGVRDAGVNDGVDPETLVRLLWRSEVLSALCALGMPPDPKAYRARMWEQLLSLVDLHGLKAAVRNALLHRDPADARIQSQRFCVS